MKTILKQKIIPFQKVQHEGEMQGSLDPNWTEWCWIWTGEHLPRLSEESGGRRAHKAQRGTRQLYCRGSETRLLNLTPNFNFHYCSRKPSGRNSLLVSHERMQRIKAHFRNAQMDLANLVLTLLLTVLSVSFQNRTHLPTPRSRTTLNYFDA